MKTLFQPRFAFLVGATLAAAAARLVPHPPNFTPIAALALFGGAQFSAKRYAFGVPLAALLLSDLVLGFYPGIWAVYGSFAAIVGIGLLVRSQRSVLAIAVGAVSASLLFFVVTNFAVWVGGRFYPPTAAGLMECYVAAVPFFRHTLAGDALYTVVLFGGLAVAERRWTVLAETATIRL